jgi:hypothetical protein
MKQYNKIYIPVQVDEAAENGRFLIGTHEVTVTDDKGKLGFCQEHLKEVQNVIVLTIEELSELWNAGYRAARADLKMETKKPALDFEKYLQSKGIDIIP